MQMYISDVFMERHFCFKHNLRLGPF